MKSKILMLLLLLYLLFVTVTGCSKIPCAEYLKQPTENIVEINLVFEQDFEKRYVLHTFTDEEPNALDDFLEKALELSMCKHREPVAPIGYLAIDISYKDGSVQVLGSDSCKYTSAHDPDNVEFDSWHYMSYSAMHELFSQYIDKDVLSSMRNASRNTEVGAPS